MTMDGSNGGIKLKQGLCASVNINFGIEDGMEWGIVGKRNGCEKAM